MTFDRPIGEKERGCDLAVRLPLGDERCDSLLRRRQLPGLAARPLIRLSSARALSAHSAAPILSKTASASSRVSRASRRRFTRRCAAPRASSVRPRSSGSSTFACHASASLEGVQCRVEIACLRREQPTTTRTVRERGLAIETTCVSLVPVQQRLRLGASVELDQRLDLIRDEAGDTWLDDALVTEEGDARLELGDSRARRCRGPAQAHRAQPRSPARRSGP